jgi:hypothetical protein
VSICATCGHDLTEGSEVYLVADPQSGEGLSGASLSVCRSCADLDLQISDTEGLPMDEDVSDKLPADAPPGDTYGTQQAATVLGVSPRRVSQLAHEGRLLIVQDKPLRVSAESVHVLRSERTGRSKHPLAAPPPESVADQVERLVSLVTAEQRRAIEAGEALLSEVSRQRDEMRERVARLEAETEQLREQLSDKTREPETPSRRRWWKK